MKNAALLEKQNLLDSLHEDYNFDIKLYAQVKKNLESNFMDDAKNVSALMETLPLNLKHQMSVAMYRPIYEKIDVLKDKSSSFISWICPLLKLKPVSPGETLFYEGGKVNNIYFVKEGTFYYCLRKFLYTPFLEIN